MALKMQFKYGAGDSSPWAAIYDAAADVYNWFCNKTGFYFQSSSGDQRVRAKLNVDASTTKFEVTSADGSKKFVVDLEGNSVKLYNTSTNRGVEITTDGINFFDDSGNKRRADMHLSTSWYAEGGVTLVRKDEQTGTRLNDESSGDFRFGFTNMGYCKGTDGTKTWTLDATVLLGDAAFNSTGVCKTGSESTQSLLRSDV